MQSIDDILPIALESYGLNGKKAGLVVIDVIKGFCEVGAGHLAPMANCDAMKDMLVEVNALSKAFVQEGRPIFAFIDSHDHEVEEPPYPTHCVKGTDESQLMDELAWFYEDPLVTCFEKDCINSYIGAIDPVTRVNQFEQWVKENEFEALVFVGVCTDICVADCVLTILSARNHGLLSDLKDVVVYLPGCATYDMTKPNLRQHGLPVHMNHPQALMHHIGAKMMSFRGAILADQIEF